RALQLVDQRSPIIHVGRAPVQEQQSREATWTFVDPCHRQHHPALGGGNQHLARTVGEASHHASAIRLSIDGTPRDADSLLSCSSDRRKATIFASTVRSVRTPLCPRPRVVTDVVPPTAVV